MAIIGILGGMMGSILVLFVISLVLGAIFMLIGARMAGVANVSFGKCVLAAIAASFITYLASLVLSIFPIIGTVLGFIAGALLSMAVIKGIFNTSFGKAFLTWIFNFIAQVVAMFLIFVLGGMTLPGLLHPLHP
jgi:hypothetical protein